MKGFILVIGKRCFTKKVTRDSIRDCHLCVTSSCAESHDERDDERDKPCALCWDCSSFSSYLSVAHRLVPNVRETNPTIMLVHEELDLTRQTDHTWVFKQPAVQFAVEVESFGGASSFLKAFLWSWWRLLWDPCGFWNTTFCSKGRFLMWLSLLHVLTLWIHFFLTSKWEHNMGKRMQESSRPLRILVSCKRETNQQGDSCPENRNVGFGAGCVCKHVIQAISTLIFSLQWISIVAVLSFLKITVLQSLWKLIKASQNAPYLVRTSVMCKRIELKADGGVREGASFRS